jgi:hypothetical protein
MSVRLVICISVLTLSPALVQAAEPASQPGIEHKLSMDKPPYGLTKASFELWLPASVGAAAPVRAVICVPNYQADATIYLREDWRAVASRQRAAILRHDMRVNTDRGSRLPVGKDATGAIFDAMAEFARLANRPELAGAPIVITGLSQGGMQTTRLTTLVPERVVAAIPFHGAVFGDYKEDSPALAVPMLIPCGSLDDLTARVMPEVPALLKLKPLAAVLMQPALPHHLLGEQDFILMWLEEMLKLRIDDANPGKLRPLAFEDGWLGQMSLNRRWLVESVSVRAVKDIPQAERMGHWLPSEKLAQAWALAVRTGYAADHESHEELAAFAGAAPKDVKVDGKLGEWGKLDHDMTYCAQILPTGLNWRGAGDCSARFSIACDDKFVYFAVRVDDDEVLAPGRAPWSKDQDGVELRIDARPAALRMANTGRGEGSDFLVVGVGPGPDGSVFVSDRDKLPAGTLVAASADAKGYAVEVAIPNTYLDAQQGAPWKRFRMNICVDDNDKDGKSQLNWRPEWRSDMTEPGLGTVERKTPTTRSAN